MFSTLQVRDSQYLLDHSRPAAKVSPLKDAKAYTLATLVRSPRSNLNRDCLETVIAGFRSDDVWNEDFLEVLIYQIFGDAKLPVNPDSNSKTIILDGSHPVVPEGPYAVHSISGNVYPVFKLYDDDHDAFVKGTLPSDQTGIYKWSESTNKIPVPSRLYSQAPTRHCKTLNGMRFAVKDSIDIAGLETGCGSRSWHEYHGTATETAPLIRQLIEAGGVLVGKTNLVPFCDGLDPLDITDSIIPINARGDKYQKTSSSSSGSASACASYSWLDFTVGTDTGGSIRIPAGVNGLYGMRPSIGTIESKGLVCTDLMDTVGIFARSAFMLRRAMACITKGAPKLNCEGPQERIRFKLLYAIESTTSLRRPTTKFFPFSADDPANLSEAGKCFENVILKLEAYFGQKRQRICLYELWKQSHPVEMSDDLIQATRSIYSQIVYRDLYQNTVQPFDQAYRARNGGRAPFIETVTKERLEQGARVTDSEYTGAVNAKNTYSSWINEILLPNPSSISTKRQNNTTGTLEVPILIYPQSWGVPYYRDEKKGRENDVPSEGFSVYSLSYCSGCPDITVPVGEVKFRSRMTGKNGHLPVSLSILAPRGTDGILLDLLSRLEEGGILKGVICGPQTFAD